MSSCKTIDFLRLGTRTTSFYIKCFKELFEIENTENTEPELNLIDVDFSEVNNFLPNKFDSLKPVLRPYFETINSEIIVVPNITLHETLDQLAIPNLIHPVRETIRELQASKHSDIFLLGSKYSMQAPYISTLMHFSGIHVQVPSLADQDKIDNLRQKIYTGRETNDDIQFYKNYIKTHSLKHPVVVACTELSIPLDSRNKAIYDMARIQISAAFRKAKA
ncbi:aspartate/glutamate racemase family protein [Hellea balneolensis]|uniref:aspartate/glutamate racemase family protein n=1 Tax=Hellea balneolensis TaxID=287478 RepID=UPI0004221474|nr:aspartate/glutamate racemase family protein [Hellea balneolensis]